MTNLRLYYAIRPTESSRTLRLRAASDYANEPVENFTEDKGLYGKPFFPSHPDVHFSVSHTGGLWVCAFADREVGCDVQEHRPHDEPKRLAQIAKRWFSAEEERYLAARGYEPAEFYRIWARKEAYVKLTGAGIAEGRFREFDMTRETNGRVIRDVALPYGPKHAAAVACGTEFIVECKALSAR
ncbi:MAG: 4'-phosphopantetheinyl transferase family protein [Eubacteriales bacterium]